VSYGYKTFYRLLLLPRRESSDSLSLPLAEDFERDRSSLLRTRRLRLLSLEDPEEELEESDSESESEDESESESLEEEGELDDVHRFLLLVASFSFPFPFDFSASFSFSLSFSFASNILLAVPLLLLNSSGTSTEGFHSAFSLANNLGFSSCCVREGLETYGLVDLHSYMKWPVPRHF